MDNYEFMLEIKKIKDGLNNIDGLLIEKAYEVSLEKNRKFEEYMLMLELSTGIKNRRKRLTRTYDKYGKMVVM